MNKCIPVIRAEFSAVSHDASEIENCDTLPLKSSVSRVNKIYLFIYFKKSIVFFTKDTLN